MNKKTILCFVVGICFVGTVVFAETITLKSGKKIEGEIVDQTGEEITIAQPYGWDDIESIVEESGFVSYQSTHSQRYMQKNNLFSIEVPKEWQWREKETGEVVILTPESDNSIVIQFKAQGGAPEDIVYETTRAMKLMFDWHNTPIVIESEKDIDGGTAHLLEYVLSSKDGRDYGVRYIFANEGYSYIVSFLGSSEKEKARMKEIVETIDFPPFQTTAAPRDTYKKLPTAIDSDEVPEVPESFEVPEISVESLKAFDFKEALQALDDPHAVAKIIGAFLALLVSMVILLVGTIMLLVAAFKTSMVWGIVCFLFPVAQLVFIIVHWQKAKKAFSIILLSCVLMALSGFVMFPVIKNFVETQTRENPTVSVNMLIDGLKQLKKDGAFPTIKIIKEDSK